MRITKRMIRRKGSGPSDTVIFVFSVILYLVMSMVFFLLLFSRGCQYDDTIEEDATPPAIDGFLMGYLRSTERVNGEKMSIAKLISYYYYSPDDYKKILEEATLKKINESNVPCLVVKITFSDDPDSKKAVKVGRMESNKCTMNEMGIDSSTGLPVQNFYGRRQYVPIINFTNVVAVVEAGVLKNG